ncbi:Arabinanase/levansucrase/invertase, partial [Clavulina sp. PMI_390]
IQVGNNYYAYSTQSGSTHVQLATSPDFQNWTLSPGYDALPMVANWSSGIVWAPDVVQLANGKFIMYYAGQSVQNSPNGNPSVCHCIGPASSATPKGPFVPFGTPICNITSGGSIDPAGFQDSDGRQYVVWKVDGNNVGNGGDCGNSVVPLVSTPIMLQEVDPSDGWTPLGQAVQILDRDASDGPLVEAPSLTHVKDPSAVGGYLYVLFYSSHCYVGGQYDSKYATSVNGVRGPYVKASSPLLSTGTDGLYSPGGLDVGPGGVRVMFHADQGTSYVTRLTRTGVINIDVASRTVTI